MGPGVNPSVPLILANGMNLAGAKVLGVLKARERNPRGA